MRRVVYLLFVLLMGGTNFDYTNGANTETASFPHRVIIDLGEIITVKDIEIR